MREGLTKADFEPYLAQTFEVHIEVHMPVEIELTEIKDRSTNLMECFFLFFRGAKDRKIRQNTYRITHPAIGEFMLFLGPVDIKKMDGIYYQAVFNRFHNNLKQKEV
jgi:hypothetical protein